MTQGQGVLAEIKAERERLHISVDVRNTFITYHNDSFRFSAYYQPSTETTSRAIPKMLTPEDIAGMVSYLASKEAEMVTGQTVSSDTTNLGPLCGLCKYFVIDVS